MWAMRMVHEASMCEHDNGSVFVTLTYEDAHLPCDWSLDKTHFQKFMKRLRKARPNQKIKYYHCGEYGNRCRHGYMLDEMDCPHACSVGRPHYHACVFNCGFGDRVAYGSTNERVRYTSPELERIWGKGFVDVGDVTIESAGYVARYVTKKVTGSIAEEHYRSVDENGQIHQLEPEYSTMSNGLGRDWYEKFKDDVFPSGEVPVPGSKGRVYRQVPRYYDEKLRVEDEGLYNRIKAERKRFAMENPAEFEPQRLESKFRVKKAQISTLRRHI